MSTTPSPTGIEAMVCADIARRQQFGIKKYGRTVAESTDDMLQHAYEEALDLAVYLKAELERRKSKPVSGYECCGIPMETVSPGLFRCAMCLDRVSTTSGCKIRHINSHSSTWTRSHIEAMRSRDGLIHSGPAAKSEFVRLPKKDLLQKMRDDLMNSYGNAHAHAMWWAQMFR